MQISNGHSNYSWKGEKNCCIYFTAVLHDIHYILGSNWFSHFGDSGCQRTSPCGTVNLVNQMIVIWRLSSILWSLSCSHWIEGGSYPVFPSDVFTCWVCCSLPLSHDSHRQKSKAAQPMMTVFGLCKKIQSIWRGKWWWQDLSLKGKMPTSMCHQMLSVDINHCCVVNATKPEPWQTIIRE